jgi:hypothetical protein
MSDLDDRNAGLNGQALPSGGNLSEWQAGRSIRQWNEAELARQNQPIPITPYTPVSLPTPLAGGGPWSGGGGTIPYSGGGTSAGPRVNPVLGLLLLIFVAAPFYQYSIPLWIALYPAAAAVSTAVYIAIFMSLAGDHTVNPTIIGLGIAFIAAWPLTLFDQMLARNPGYWMLRHIARLPLIGIWAIYALSVRDWKLGGSVVVPHRLPDVLVFSPAHIAIAIGAMIVMHVFLGWGRLIGRKP